METRKRRRRWPWLVAALVVVAGAAGGVWWWQSRSQPASGQPAVTVETVAPIDLETTVQAPAAVAAADEKEYRAAFKTLSVHLEVKPGMEVQAGQLLATLDATAQEAAVRRARAELASAQLELQRLELRLEQAPLLQQHKLEAAREAVAEAELALNRALALHDQNVEAARLQVAEAAQRLESARAASGGMTRDEVVAAQQRLRQAEDAVAAAPGDPEARAALARAEDEYRSLLARQRELAVSADQAVARARQDLAAAQVELAGLAGDQPADLLTARHRLAQAQRGLEQVQLEISSDTLLAEQLTVQRLAVASAEQNLADAESRLNRAEIRAEAGGVVLAVPVAEGAPVDQDALVLVVGRLDRMRANLKIDESDIAAVQVGMEIVARSPGHPGQEYPGKITLVAPEANGFRAPDSRGGVVLQGFAPQGGAVTFPAEAEIENVDQWLRPGMNLDITVRTGTRPGALSVPVQAVVGGLGPMAGPVSPAGPAPGSPEAPGGQYVWVVKDGKAERRPVETGIRAGDRLEITSGLSPGEQVVVGPFPVLRSLVPGQEVRVAPEGQPADLPPDAAPAPGGGD